MRLHLSSRFAAVLLGASLLTVGLAVPPAGGASSTVDSLKTTLGGGAHDTVVNKTLGAKGPVEDVKPPGSGGSPPGETTIDLSGILGNEQTPSSLQVATTAQQCAAGSIPPQIFKAKGKLTSGGYLVLEGACFGNNGSVEISGFPKGDLQVTNEAWTPTAITLQLPNISGVPDLTMHIQVKWLLKSKVFDAPYTAAMGDPVDLPAADIVPNECAALGICMATPGGSVGIHIDPTDTNGSDVWTFKVPDHFHVHAVEITHVTSGHTTFSWINGTGSSKTFQIAWNEAAKTETVPVTTTSNNETSASSIFDDILTGGAAAAVNQGTTTTTTMETVTIYNEVYKFEVLVRGPAGMNP